MRIRTVFVIVALLALMTSLSMSQYAARESFDYPVGASLDTLMGTATNGWAGPWHKVTAKQANAMAVADTGFPYADLSYSVSNVGQHLEGLADSNEQRYARPLDKTWPNNAGQVYWISVLMDVKNALDNATWLGVKLYFGDAGEVMMFGKGHGLDKYTVGSGWHGGAGPEVSTISWTAGPVWLVGKIVMQGGASATNDTAYMWINPDPAGGEPSTTPDGVANSKWATGFNTVRVEFGGNISPGGLGLSVDEIRLGTSWAEVSSVQYAARESFEYPVGTSLDTLMGTATNGWAGPWHKVTAKQANAMAVADTGFPYADLSYSVSNVGNHLEGLADSNEQRYARPLDKTWPNNAGQVYWISLLMDAKNALDNATWLGVKLYFGDAGEVMMFGKGHGLDKYTVGSGWHGGAGPEVSTISWTAGPVWLVGKIAMQGGASATNDTAYMWINPDPAGGEPSTTPDGVANSKWANGFNTVRVEFGGNISPGGLGLSVDEIRLGTSWTDVSVPLMITGVTPQHNVLPFEFTLSQNYPNPFNPTSNISYTLQNSGRVRLAVYDLLGREVAVLVNSVQNSGSHEVTFSGTGLSSGIYFYRLESSGQAITKKMVLLK